MLAAIHCLLTFWLFTSVGQTGGKRAAPLVTAECRCCISRDMGVRKIWQ